MPRYELKIPIGSSELVIAFESLEDLNNKAEEIKNILENANKLVGIKEEKRRKVKEGFEDVYQFNDEGLVELLKVPDGILEKVILVMYAYHPESVSTVIVAKCSGVKDAGKNYLASKSCEKYFNNDDRGVYSLKHPALDLIRDKIIPQLRGENKPNNSQANTK